MIRFGSRGSDLALTQSRAVAEELRRRTGEDYEIEIIRTRGDEILGTPLAEIGGKGLFTAELEEALRAGRIDVAVHSLKDLPVEDPDGLTVGAIPPRENPHDVLVFDPAAADPEGGTVPLRAGSVVGTSSPRRMSSLLALRPDLEMSDIRGNVGTRAQKVADGDYQATILAAAGLARLGLETPALSRQELPVEACTPAPGQGALGVQCRRDDPRIRELLATIHDPTTAACVKAERDLLLALGGGCSMPLGALAQPDGDGFRMSVSLFSEHRPTCGVRFEVRDPDPARLAQLAADELAPLMGDPLTGQTIALLRPAGSDGQLARGLGLAGAEVATVTVSEIHPIDERSAALTAAELSYVAFTSARAVDRFFEQAAAHGFDLGATVFFAGGPATADAVRRRGMTCSAPDTGAGGKALFEHIQASATPQDARILFPCAENRHRDFEELMQAAGRTVEALPVYRTVVVPGIEIPTADHVVFTSPSAVRAFDSGPSAIGHHSLLALGPTTADAMSAVGLPPRGVAAAPTAHALVQLIRDL